MASYYVSPNGSNDATGQLEAPFASLQHAHDLAKPGDTIYMRGGVYELTSDVVLTNDGTSGNPITVTNYQDEVPILDGSSISGGYVVVNMESASWNHIKGLEIRNGAEGGLAIEGQSHNNIIEGLDVHHNGWNSEWEGKGISLFGAGSNNLLLNNDSHHNQDLNRDNADGFALGSTTGTGNVLRGNKAWANSDDGFDFFNAQNNTDAGSYVIEGNWAFDNGYANDGSAGGDGYGFKLGGARQGTSSTSGGHTVSDNVAWGNRSVGFSAESSDPVTLENNTAYNNGLYNYGFWAGEHTFRNNLSAGTGKVEAYGSTEGNSWTMPVTVDSSDFVSLDDSTARGDRAADGSLPTTQFLHLANGSDLAGLGAVQTAAPSGGVAPVSETPSTPSTPSTAAPSGEVDPVSDTPSTPSTAAPSGEVDPVSATPSTPSTPSTAAPSGEVDPVSDTPSTPSEPETKPVSGNASGPGQAPIGQPDYSAYKEIDGNGAANSIVGTSAAELIDGKSGNDKLFGGDGNDILEGGNGRDRLTGGGGNDFHEGGRGADVFVFHEANWGTDVILDWQAGIDRLDLRETGLEFDDLEFVPTDIDGDSARDDVFAVSDHGNIGLLDIHAVDIHNSSFMV